MRPRGSRLRLQDILQAIERIEEYTRGMGFDEFCEDTRTVDAVVRNLEIIGEASRHIAPSLLRRHPEVRWHRIWGLRNVLAHGYFGVDLSIVWHTVTLNLPPLAPLLEALLEAEDLPD